MFWILQSDRMISIYPGKMQCLSAGQGCRAFARYLISFVLFLSIYVPGVAADNDCRVLAYNTKITFHKRDLITETTLYLEVTDPSCRNLSEISIPFRKDEQPDIIEASIIDRLGNVVREIRKKDIEISSDIDYGTFYSDEFKMSFSLYWHEYPYRIRLIYRKVLENYIYVARWTPYYSPYLPVESASFTLTVPDDMAISVFQRGNFVADTSKTDDGKIFQWKIEDLPEMEHELMSPALSDLVPQVIIMPDVFRYELEGHLQSWNTYGQWFDELTRGLEELTQEEKAAVAGLTTGISDRKDIVRKLYHYLQDNTRYVNVTLETGGFKPFPAAYVCQNKYGDCKSLSVYMKGLLREAGIESFYVHINSGTITPEIIREAPGPQFNHMILCVPLDNDTLWLDNTATTSPFAYPDADISGRTALLINGSESRLITMPSTGVEAVMNHSLWVFDLDENGNGTATGTMKLRGDSFHSFAVYRKYISEQRLRDSISDYIPFTDANLREWKMEQPDRDSGFMVLQCKLDVRNQFKAMGKYIVSRPISIKTGLSKPLQERNYDFVIPQPVAQTDTLIYNLPFKYRYTAELPESSSFTNEFGCFEIDASESPGEVKIIRKMVLKRGRYNTEVYKLFYEFLLRAGNTFSNSQLILKQNR